MTTTNKIVELIDKSTIEGEPYMKRRAVVCYLLQLFPWLIYIGILILLSLVNIIAKITSDNYEVFNTVCYSSILVIVLISLLGLFIAFKNYSRGLNVILLLILLIAFAGLSIGYFSLQFIKNSIMYTFALGPPFIFLTISHLIGSFLLSKPSEMLSYGKIIWAITLIIPTMIFILDEVFFPDGEHFELFLEILVGVTSISLLTASWLTSVKTTFTTK